MTQVRFIQNGESALVSTGGRDILVEQAKVVLKRMRHYWARVLIGQATTRMGNHWAFQLVLGTLSLGEKLVTGLQRFVKKIVPDHFRFIIQTPRVKFALVWG